MRRAGLQEVEEGLRIGGKKIKNVCYADDTNLIAANITDLQKLILKQKAAARTRKKTKIMSTTNLQRFNLVMKNWRWCHILTC